MRILIVIPLNEDEKERLQSKMPEAEYIYVPAKEITEELVKSSDIIIGNVPPEYIKGSKKLKWLQLNSAGTDGYCEAGVIPEGAYLTNASGAYGLAISEHMLSMLLEIRKKLSLYYINQKEHAWKDEGNVTSIEGSTALIVGLGDIGGDFGRNMKVLGSYTVGIKRTKGQKPEYIDELYTMEALDSLLPRADVVALSLPGTLRRIINISIENFEHFEKQETLKNIVDFQTGYRVQSKF